MMQGLKRYLSGVSWSTSIFNGVQVCVYILGVLLVIWIASKIGTSIGSNSWPPPITTISTWVQIVVAYAAIFAIGQYAVAYADIADRKTKLVLELVRFFRESVLEKGSLLNIYTKKHKISVPLIALRKNTPHFKFTAEEFFNKIVPNQKQLVETYSETLVNDPEFESMAVGCLNAAEEFAIGILNSKSQDHKAVSSIKKPFIEIVEQFAVPLYYQIGMMDDQFTYLSRLYRHWKSQVGFLPNTKEDRVARYEERLRRYVAKR